MIPLPAVDVVVEDLVDSAYEERAGACTFVPMKAAHALEDPALQGTLTSVLGATHEVRVETRPGALSTLTVELFLVGDTLEATIPEPGCDGAWEASVRAQARLPDGTALDVEGTLFLAGATVVFFSDVAAQGAPQTTLGLAFDDGVARAVISEVTWSASGTAERIDLAWSPQMREAVVAAVTDASR